MFLYVFDQCPEVPYSFHQVGSGSMSCKCPGGVAALSIFSSESQQRVVNACWADSAKCPGFSTWWCLKPQAVRHDPNSAQLQAHPAWQRVGCLRHSLHIWDNIWFWVDIGRPIGRARKYPKKATSPRLKISFCHIFFDFPPFSHEDSHIWGTGPRLRASSAARSPPNGTSQMAVRSLRGCSCLGGSHAPFNVDIHI